MLGGKREIVPLIFRAAQEAGYGPAQGHVWVEPFLGGGSVGLTAKALGYAVVAGDTSVRSAAVGDGLLVNDGVRLAEADLALALEHDPGFLPPVRDFPFTDEARDAFARVAAAAADAEDPRRGALLRLLVFKAAQRIAPYSQPNAAGSAAMRIRSHQWDGLSEYDRGFHVPRFTRPIKFLVQSLDELRAGIFANGQPNSFARRDALALIDEAGFERADVLYLDPPYPGTKVYETHFRALDSLLEGRAIDDEPSRFSAKDGWTHIAELLAAARDWPLWILSLGNASVELEPVEAMIRDLGREPITQSMAHMHLKGTSSAEHRADNRELVITAKAA